MFQRSSSPASLGIFTILSAIRLCSMVNLIRGVLRGEKKAVGINKIKNMRFPEMHIYSILLISMASSSDVALKIDCGNLKNPKCSTHEITIPSEKMYRKGIISAKNKSVSPNHPLKKLSSCKVGLGIILGSPFDNILFSKQVKGDFPKPIGAPPSNSSPVNTKNVDMTNIRDEWPCVFAPNQGPNSVITRDSPLITKGSKQLAVCTKHRNAGFLSLEDIENTDNYTRLINYLPNPKVTHMYNYCILEFPQRHSSNGYNFNNTNPVYPPRVHNIRRWSILTSNENFLKNCEICSKPLEGRDVYIYRGESSFCSLECRYWKVKAEREFEKVTRMVPRAPSSSNKKLIFHVGAKSAAAASA